LTDAIEEAVARGLCRRGYTGTSDLEGAVDLFWREYVDEARAAISAHITALTASGYVIVPKEPTDDVRKVIKETPFYDVTLDEHVEYCWKALTDHFAVATLPPPQAQVCET
jgi:hypothetical protein